MNSKGFLSTNLEYGYLGYPTITAPVIFLSLEILNKLSNGESSLRAILSNIPAQQEPNPRVGAYSSKYANEKIEFSLPRGKPTLAVAKIILGAPRKIVSIPSSR